MMDKLKEAFDQVQADETLKIRTKAYISQKTNGYTQRNTSGYRQLISAAVCILLVLVGGHWFYFTPTVEISIDINPSIELGINRFDQVVSVNGYNDDGQELLTSLDIIYLNYSDAVEKILQDETIMTLLSQDEMMMIGVIGTEGVQSSKILSDIESCTAEKRNMYCYNARSEEVEAAHKMGLSCGKYKAFLELQALDPNISVEEIRNMSMKEMREYILSNNDGNIENIQEYGRCGNGHRRGNGQERSDMNENTHCGASYSGKECSSCQD